MARNPDRTPFLLRMPTALKERLTELAAANRRSLNEQITYLCERYVENATAKERHFVESITKLQRDARAANLTRP